MFKSCDYCRHRKKKCVVPIASGRCTDCEHLDLPCEFSQRLPSLKRRQTSKRIAARVGIAPPESPKPSNDSAGRSDNEFDEANLKEGDCQLRLAGRRDMANKRLFQPRGFPLGQEDCSLSISEQYWRDVHPFWPFATPEMLEDGELGKDPGFMRLTELALRMSLNSMREPENVSWQMAQLVSALQRGRPTIPTIAGTLLLCPFLYLDDGLLQTVFDTIGLELASGTCALPLPVLSGALLINVWRRLAGHSHPPLDLPSGTIQSHAQTLDPTTFGYHFVRLSYIVAEFDQRRLAMDAEGIQPDTPCTWSKLEYECLLWQVCLAPTLLDTRDELPATPESVVIHCFSNLLLLSFYSFVLERASTLGTLIALRPVPGVLLFLCSLARSTFICPRKLLDRMSMLVRIQAQTARIMLRLWHHTNFENFRAILNLWENPGNRFPDLARQVREEIGTGPWSVDEIDGYSVFWTFRDLRSLTTKFIFTNRVMD